MRDPPKGFITAVEHASSQGLLAVASIAGEVCIYATGETLEETTTPWRRQFGAPVVAVACFEDTVLVVQPKTVTAVTATPVGKTVVVDADGVERVVRLDLAEEDEENVYLVAKVGDDANVLVLGTSNGTVTLCNVPDLAPMDTVVLPAKVQCLDVHGHYLVVATAAGENAVFDLSCRKLVRLATQDAGFKYPVCTDVHILPTVPLDASVLPHTLVYAQAGLEGKVSVVSTRIEAQTEPTVTVTTAATMAPVSASCTNSSGLVVASTEPQRFIFKAHRSKLSDDTVLVRPVYSLNSVGPYLLTSGYGGDNGHGKISIEGSICLWDVAAKKRVKMCRGLPLTVVRTAVWHSAGVHHVVCGCSDDVYKNMPLPDHPDVSPNTGATPSVLVLLQMAGDLYSSSSSM